MLTLILASLYVALILCGIGLCGLWWVITKLKDDMIEDGVYGRVMAGFLGGMFLFLEGVVVCFLFHHPDIFKTLLDSYPLIVFLLFCISCRLVHTAERKMTFFKEYVSEKTSEDQNQDKNQNN